MDDTGGGGEDEWGEEGVRLASTTGGSLTSPEKVAHNGIFRFALQMADHLRRNGNAGLRVGTLPVDTRVPHTVRVWLRNYRGFHVMPRPNESVGTAPSPNTWVP